MRKFATAAILAVCLVPSGASGSVANDPTPLSCDGKPVGFHVHRAKALIEQGYALSRIPDPAPMKRAEKKALRSHKFCVRDEGRRDRIAHYRDKAAKGYQHALAQAAPWLTKRGKALVAQYAGALASIRACESGGDYQAVDASGTYYGAYQFDFQTWGSVGGSGSPAAASPAEQDYRAALLYSQRGSSPWPVCG